MLNAGPQHETIILDDPDADRPTIAIGRVATVELTMQVHVFGEWHRRTPDLRETACGVPIRPGEEILRREILTEDGAPGWPAGLLCRVCFTAHETQKARKADHATREAVVAEAQRWLDEAPQRVEKMERRAWEASERHRLSRQPKKEK